jgi:hypothetical protein
VFLYDYQTQTADQLRIQTDAGSISFGNPTIEEVQIGGRDALVMTLFVFLDGSAGREDGSLVYYCILHPALSRAEQPVPGRPSHGAPHQRESTPRGRAP